MIKKSYKIGNVLSISVRAKESVFKNIDKYFPNIREIEENNIDYLIIYSEVDNILESYKNIIDSKLIKPFRNLTYNVSTFDSILIAYASKQEFSDDTLIIKEKNKIIIL